MNAQMPLGGSGRRNLSDGDLEDMPPTFSIGPKLPFAVADKGYPLAEFRKSVFAENLTLATATDPPSCYYTSVTSNTDRAKLV